MSALWKAYRGVLTLETAFSQVEYTQQKAMLQHYQKSATRKHRLATTSKTAISLGRTQRSYSSRTTRRVPVLCTAAQTPLLRWDPSAQHPEPPGPEPPEPSLSWSPAPLCAHFHATAQHEGGFLHKPVSFLPAYGSAACNINHRNNSSRGTCKYVQD